MTVCTTTSASSSPTTRRTATVTRSASSTTRRWSSTAIASSGSGRRAERPDADERVSLRRSASVIPGFVDSHAHLVFAGDRSAEFAARMSGEPYGGGGIASTVAATRAADDANCRTTSPGLATSCSRAASPPSRRKSGYGLTVADEARSLRIAGASPTRRHFSARTSCPPSSATTAMTTSGWSPVTMLAGLRADRPRGSTCSAIAARSTSTRPATSWTAGAMRASAAAARRPTRPQRGHPARRRARARHRSTTARSPPTTTSRRSRRRRHHCRHPAARRRILHPRTVARCEAAPGRGRHRRACDRLQSRQLVHHQHAVLHRSRGAGHELHPRSRRCGRPPRAEPRHCAATTSACSPSGRRADFVVLDAPSYIHLAYRPGVPLVRDVVKAGERIPTTSSGVPIVNSETVVVGIGPVELRRRRAGRPRRGRGRRCPTSRSTPIAKSRARIEELAERTEARLRGVHRVRRARHPAHPPRACEPSCSAA